MKRILSLLLLSSTFAFSQLPSVVVDNFNSYSDGTDVAGDLSWIKIPAGSPSDSTLVATGGYVTASNLAGAQHYGGLTWNVSQSNNGTSDTLYVGFVVAAAMASTPGYQNPQYEDVILYLLMNNTSSTWTGTIINFGSWGGYAFRITFDDITNGVKNGSTYGGSGLDEAPGISPPSTVANDTFYVKIYGQTIQVYNSKAGGAGPHLLYTQLSRKPLPTSGYCAIQVRNSGTSSTKITAAIIGVPNYIPPVCDDTDDSYPIVASVVPSHTILDFTQTDIYHTARVTDLSTCAIRNTGIAWASMVRDTVDGSVTYDSIHVTPSLSASNYGHGDTTFSLPPIQQAIGSYRIKTTIVDSVGLITVNYTYYSVQAERVLTVQAYYDVWQMIPLGSAWWAEPPDRLDYTNGVSHIIVFPNGNIRPDFTDTLGIFHSMNPWFGPARYDSAGTVRVVNLSDSMDANYGTGRPTNPTHYLEDLVARAHAQNVRVLFCINAVCATGIDNVLDQNGNNLVDGLDSARIDTLARTIARWTKDRSLDGVDINIEHGCANFPGKPNISCFMRRLRIRLDQYNAGIGGRMTITFSPTSGDEGSYDAATSNANVDQINPQTYDNQYAWSDCLGGNMTWEAGPIYPPSDAASCVGAGNLAHNVHQHGPYRWVNAGFSKSILGYGVSTYGRLRRGGTNSTSRYGTFPSTATDGYAHNTQAFIDYLLSPAIGGIQEAYDDSMESIAIHGTNLAQIVGQGDFMTVAPGTPFRYTYPNPQRIQADIDYLTREGFKGLMLFDYQMDCDPSNPDITKRNWLIDAAGKAAGGQLPLLPSAPANILPANAATNQSATGLLFTWTSVTGALTYHFQLATDAAFSSVERDFPNLTTNQCQVGQNPFTGTLNPGILYYWRVSATTSGGASNYSTATSFTTLLNLSTPPHTPVQVAPTNASTSTSTSVTLTITLAPLVQDTISNIVWQVKTDTLSTSFVVNDASGNSLTYNLLNLTPSVKYFWRAATRNVVGTSAFTGWYNFTISVVVSVPTKYKTPVVYDPAIRKNLPTGTPTSGLIFRDDPVSSFTRPGASGLGAGGLRGWVDSAGIQHIYVDFLNLPVSSFTMNATNPLSWNATNSTMSLFPASVTQAGYVAAADYANRIAGRRYNHRVSGGNADSTGVVFRAGTNMTITQSINLDTLTFNSTASGGGTTDPDTSILTLLRWRDEFLRTSDGVANMATGAVGSSANLQGDLGWTPYALVNGNRARVFTVGQQYVNTSTYSPGMGWQYLVAPDSSDGTTPTGGCLTLARSGPVKYGRPVKALFYGVMQIPQMDSTYALVGFTSKVQGAEDLRLTNTESVIFEVGTNSASAPTIDTVYVVTSNGSAKTRTAIGTATVGAVYHWAVRYNASSVDFYWSAQGAALGTATNVTTTLPAFTSGGCTPYIGGVCYKKTTNASSVGGPSTNHMVAVDALEYKEWIAR